MQDSLANFSIDDGLERLRSRYASRNPRSLARHRAAESALPGGNTRSILHFDPFPLFMERGVGAELWDVDGHCYVDCVGEFSAGLYGHSDPVIVAAIHSALERGLVMAAPTDMEAQLAEAIRARFPSVERLRFCNSGTEANVLALMTAMAVTGRKKILVFREAYHGGVLAFPGNGNPVNLPLDYVLGDFNDGGRAEDLIRRHRDELAAAIVEPILGAGGNIPATRDFLGRLRAATAEAGALLVLDEVKTSRCGAGGMQGRLGIRPDLTTFGKYIGGGLSSGAFGGRADIMERFNPKRPDAFRHAGTFNNNVCSMTAGLAGLTKVFTPERADRFLDESEAFRRSLNSDLAARDLPMHFSGLGSMFTLHFRPGPILGPNDIPPNSRRLGQLFHMHCIQAGVLVASRGDVFLSLPMDERHRSRLRDALDGFVAEYEPLIRRVCAA